MSKRSDRPWETQWSKDMLVAAQAVLEAPSVTVDGVRFWSDRFYLNDTHCDTLSAGKCMCGAQQAPPLMSRERLVQSLDLKAAVLGTFSIDIAWLRQSFPKLVGPNATVPTLILHGDKRIQKLADGSAAAEEEDDDSATSLEHSTNNNTEILFDRSIPSRTARENQSESSSLGRAQDSSTSTLVEMTTCPISEVDKAPFGLSFASHLGQECYFSFVLSAWNKVLKNNSRVSNESAATNNQSTLESKRGVHHSKFMLLLETNGDLVVVVSTANLTRAETTDGIWLQRFRPNRRYQQKQSHRNFRRPVAHGNGFGIVLQDFLEKLDDSARGFSVAKFFSHHMHISLTELAPLFHFEKAQVHLIPVIPGNYKPKCSSYGRQRVQHILSRETLILSDQDRLIVQPTSFGGNWRQGEMVDLVRSYLHDDESRDDEVLLDRMDVIWPSRTFMRNANRPQEEVSADQGENASHQDATASFVFMSSRSFNSCDRSCISRIARFESSNPPQLSSSLVPHFKSIARLVNKHSVVRKHGFQVVAQDYLSWFLLTSACLSHGAQGKRVKDLDPFATTKETIQYANFELGVLFTSRVRPRDKRLYCFRPNVCSCNSFSDPQQRMIHLPIPYSLHPKLYQLNDHDSTMEETPFFHEIESGTRCVGNMLLTPYGIMEAKKQAVLAKQNIDG